ncbi:hypothetical protein T10_9818 [Trichinella papuae]|uniref:Uncharacterized protein n=1 Tax=Trichinella papuae TaxID=268474 RepID=A0A0V1MTD5_9BILA|nr:hypothetical protein T10_9818 [Trichinella papuae]
MCCQRSQAFETRFNDTAAHFLHASMLNVFWNFFTLGSWIAFCHFDDHYKILRLSSYTELFGTPFVNYPFPSAGISKGPLNSFSIVFSCLFDVSSLAFLGDGVEQ